MKKSRFSTEQMVRAVQEMEAGRPVAEVDRHLGVGTHTVYGWNPKLGGVEVCVACRLRD